MPGLKLKAIDPARDQLTRLNKDLTALVTKLSVG